MGSVQKWLYLEGGYLCQCQYQGMMNSDYIGEVIDTICLDISVYGIQGAIR